MSEDYVYAIEKYNEYVHTSWMLYTLYFLACIAGTYGAKCKHVCGHCINHTSCNKINGSCPGECKPGYDFHTDSTCKKGIYFVINLPLNVTF